MMIRQMLHAFSVLDRPMKDIRDESLYESELQKRKAYRDPQLDLQNLERAYDAALKEGCDYMKRAQELSGMSRECFDRANRIMEQMEAVEHELQRLRA